MLRVALFVPLESQGTELVIVNNFDVPVASGKKPQSSAGLCTAVATPLHKA